MGVVGGPLPRWRRVIPPVDMPANRVALDSPYVAVVCGGVTGTGASARTQRNTVEKVAGTVAEKWWAD
jgi:hypothetical protein